ncbi:TPA: restriction endonuclease subunit S [Klebsiella aerogenes]|jgi:type I restriction enzyme S subunit|nr:restriction endonuclease subunit S [Klebsiella aerogenes]HDU4052784.1 restriction endonuclease subunit S [Klebsiella aerogenes]
MAKYKAYPAYKTTGLGWLTEIPDHWEVKKLKYLGQAIIGLTYSPDDVVDEGEGTLVLRSSNVQNGKLEFLDNVYVRKSIPLHLKVKEGDILICARNGSRALIGKNAKITKDAEGMTFGAFMSIFRSRYNNYLSHVFASALFEYQSGSFLTATINQLTTSNLNSFEIPLPPQTEQDRIVNFLDHETAKIDNLIEKQQQLIELLKEKRQAVISHAVTKGLNPDVPMKDSGVEWLGDVPQHWRRSTPIKYLSSLKGRLGWQGLKADEYRDEGPYVVSSAHFNNYEIDWNSCPRVSLERYKLDSNIQLDVGDILLMKDGAAMGKLSYVDQLPGEACLNSHLLLFRPLMEGDQKTYDTKFMFYLMQTNHFQSFIKNNGTGSTFLGISQQAIGNHSLCLPPYNEQVEISDYLDDELSKIVRLETMQLEMKNLLTERRTALISAAVTGKIDVRDWVAPDTQNVEEPQEATA